MPIMPRMEEKTKKIAYKIIGTPSNMQPSTDKSGKKKKAKKGKKD